MRAFAVIVLCAAILVSCNQNMEPVRDGETLADSPKPVADPNAHPLARPGGEVEVPPFVKAYFMHMFVEALYSPPQNKNPNPNWKSPLADSEKGRVWCTDCHTSGQVDFAKIPKQKLPMNAQLEENKEFMGDLMKKWVARLNSDDYLAKRKLKEPVTCLTCHETNPAP